MKIVCKKIYADWNRLEKYTQMLHDLAFELIDIPRRSETLKKFADIRLCFDAMDLPSFKEHINSFVAVSGDIDFSPLVSKLKELGKHVIGLGMRPPSSEFLRDNCDEFIYYEDLGGNPGLDPAMGWSLLEGKLKVFELLMESLLAKRWENKSVLRSSKIKDTVKRKKRCFNDSYRDLRTFSEVLEEARDAGLLEVGMHEMSRNYTVLRFGNELRRTLLGSDTSDSNAARSRTFVRRGGDVPATHLEHCYRVMHHLKSLP